MGTQNDTGSSLEAENVLLPEMRFSDGSALSRTAAPSPIASSASAAQERFHVAGTALLTGGAGALALSCARALLEHGVMHMMLWDRDFTHAQEPLSTLQLDFPDVVFTTATLDVTDSKTMKELLEHYADKFGGIDILCCFAGTFGCEQALQTRESDWRRILDTNLTGTFFCAQAVANHMVQTGPGGSIVFIACKSTISLELVRSTLTRFVAISGHRVNFPQPQVAYNASKAGVIHLTKCLAAELAVNGIRVNSISPGYMDTAVTNWPGVEGARDVWCARNPMGRMGKPHELHGALILLCSQAGSYINGTDILVDGGQSIF